MQQELADEHDLIDLFLTRYSRYLSNESMKMLGQRKEVIKELLVKIDQLRLQYEKESKKSMGKSGVKKSQQVQDTNLQTKSN